MKGFAAWGACWAVLAVAAVAAVAAASPGQVHIGCVDQPATSAVIGWVTDTGTQQSVVRYGTDIHQLDRSATGQTNPRPNLPNGEVHEVTLTSLQPDTRYYYVCGNLQDGWSSTFSFKTAPAPGAYVPIHFTMLGDQGTTPEAISNIALAAGNAPDFHIVLGDLSYANGNQPVWDLWFELNEPLFARNFIWPVIGNHDNEDNYGVSSYTGRFALPNNERWYSVRWGRALFLFLDTESLYLQLSPQYTWVEQELTAANLDPSLDWVFVAFHKPHYPGGDRTGEWQMAISLLPLFEAYRVDFVFAGHDHLFMRTFPMANRLPTDNSQGPYVDPAGIIHVVSGGGGKSLYEAQTSYYAARSVSLYHYCTVDITPNGRTTVKAIETASGLPFHSIVVEKTGLGPSPTPLPTFTLVPTPSPTETPLPTSTPLPTDTPEPMETPSPTKTPLPATPTWTSRPKPCGSLLAGYWDTRLENGAGPVVFQAITACGASAPPDQVGIFTSGFDSGAALTPVDGIPGLFRLGVFISEGSAGTYLLELQAKRAGLREGPMWPYLEVEP